ncbi:MAG: DUF1801 domain-containing protein [Flavobacteriales bacterium]|jgi:uncharacterized protein YdhG (YjbR/CyaY superfamily)|nr:DUF1801 domain-containing protein [Flavobacteriales bacterium]MBK6752878.1 DUF1801 domain-containing protein [Flavobacteriales bacterium]MBK7085280.1 DUF1801 domain-containing protein [Flavobacteriales bacterium]MBK7754504.1 DUF1801 domain-containing protein [Flavobacteriales bacterium]MBK9075783.1 DUF1801 domain-containing protein [Flavobacteriales bacterium]
MKISAADPEAYFASLPKDRREALLEIRNVIRTAWPKVTEDLSFGMPTYHLDGNAFCAVASQKNFMALYVMHHDLLNAFHNDLRAYDRGRSCIRFRRLEPPTVELFDRIVKYTGSRYLDSLMHGKQKAAAKVR